MSSIRTLVSELHAWEWLAILLARLTVGLLFSLSGRGKLFVAERREQMRQTLLEAHVPFPDFNTIFVSMVEFVFGAFLLLGFATALACVMLGCVMIAAISTTAIKNIRAMSPLGRLSEFLYLPEVLCLVILVWISLSGPGWFSIDYLMLCKTVSYGTGGAQWPSSALYQSSQLPLTFSWCRD